jgi:hypothetical protein
MKKQGAQTARLFLSVAWALIALAFCGCEQPAGPKLGDIADLVEGVPAAPGRPELLADDQTLVVVWNTVLIADTYTVYYNTVANHRSAQKWEGELELGAGTASAVITGLTNEVTYYVWVSATNKTGESPKSLYASASPVPGGTGNNPRVFFDYGWMIPSYDTGQTGRFYTVSSGKSLVMSPVLWRINESAASYAWEVSGGSHSSTGANQRYFTFWPSAAGDYTVTVTVNGLFTASATVKCTSGYSPRPAGGESQAKAGTVFGFMPGPGQFVDNADPYSRGIPASGYGSGLSLGRGVVFNAAATESSVLNVVQQVVDAAGSEYIASLGTFGGYLITGFDHSVARRQDGKAEISIRGNAFGAWEEPGVVWVSRDDNGNGQPDDTWYEIKGSAYGHPSTLQQYAVTYYRPTNMEIMAGIAKNNAGTTGGYGRFFPLMYNLEYYTLTGTLIKEGVGTGGVDGYVDCVGPGRFKISDAIQLDGSPANLDYIDFVKVQNASYGQTENLGEWSCETGVAFDLSLPDPGLLFHGVLVTDGGPNNGKYRYTFGPASGYDLWISIDGGEFFEHFRGMGAKTLYLEEASIYFDYSGGNIRHYHDEPGYVGFGMR